jgi:hypothetical protein
MDTKLQVCNTYLRYEVQVLTSCIESSVPIDMAIELYSLHLYTDIANNRRKNKLGSEFLAIDPEVLGSILGATRFSVKK